MSPDNIESLWSQLSRRDLLAKTGLLLAGSMLSDAFLSLTGPALKAFAGSEILQEMRRFQTTGSVLYVAAHPDDENTELIAYFARGLNYRTAYLSLTRGDGGQNVIGGEIGADLGAIRTQELLAARRLDGGRQFFTRALDFGFSKDFRETLKVWDRQQVLADIVRVIRTFRPDVVITRFAPEPSGTHGHHTASAVLAVEAFKLSGDPNAFPDQLKDLKPWQPKRILQNGGGGTDSPTIEIGATDAVLGVSFSEIAGRSRGMHQSQFGTSGFIGGRGGARREAFRLLGGDPASKDIFEGIDLTWSRVGKGGEEIGALAAKLISEFNESHLEASMPLLLEIRGKLNARPSDPLVHEKKKSLDLLIQHCLGLVVETTIPNAEVVPGEKLRLRHTAHSSSTYPVRWVATHYPVTGRGVDHHLELRSSELSIQEDATTLPANTPISQPYWLRKEPTAGMFIVDNPKDIGLPENPPAFPVAYEFLVGGQTINVETEPVQLISGSKGTRRVVVIAPVSILPETGVRLFAPGASRTISIAVTAARAEVKGVLALDVPAGWSVTPAKKAFDLKSAGNKVNIEFTVHAPAQPEVGVISAHAMVNGKSYGVERKVIDYPHIPILLLQPAAVIKAVALNCDFAAKKVGYLPGAGDGVAAALTEMGCAVTQLTGADLVEDKLSGFDALVVGVRAFNVRTDLSEKTQGALATFAERGGTVILQYNRPDGLKTPKLLPYRLQLSTLRITDEHAPVTILAPDHTAFNKPNKITLADFDGWVQERGTYFASDWDPNFTSLLASSDPGEDPLKGGLLVAPYGKGNVVYTGLTFFRQLPAGVPGAYRLFANLGSLGR